MAPFAALIFDLDNTLVDAEAAYAHALRAVDIDPAGQAFLAARRTVKARLGDGHICAHNRLLYFKVLLEAHGLGPKAILARMRAYEGALGAHLQGQWHTLARSGLIAALRHGRDGAARRPCLILTNENTRTQLLKWQALDPNGTCFTAMLTSEELGWEKPDARVFAAALARLGVPAAACLMVGDDPTADIAPALACGMAATWTSEFRRGPVPTLPEGARRIARLDQLLEAYPW